MAYTIIDDASEYFQCKKWTGTGGQQAVTYDSTTDHATDWIWHKEPADTNGWHQADSTEASALSKWLASDNTNAQYSTGAYVAGVDANGITYAGGDSSFNSANTAQCTWSWHINGGTNVNNTVGTGIDSVVQVSQTAGISTVQYDGDGTQSGRTVGHGLGAVPTMIISKDRDSTSNVPHWRVYHVGIGNTKYLSLSETSAQSTFNDWDNTSPTSTVYSVGGAGGYTPTNTNNTEYKAWLFADVQGYSKHGKYIGNGGADGVFVYTGFKPAFLMWKRADATGDWRMVDNKNGVNGAIPRMKVNSNTAQGSAGDNVDLVSNGFKHRSTSASSNAANSLYVYMCFAENPLVTSGGVPSCASGL